MSVRNGVTVRGTTNGNDRGGSEARRRRRAWLVEIFRANVDVQIITPIFHPDDWIGYSTTPARSEPLPGYQKACRCYRCGVLLTVDRVTVDRIVPGCRGGTYRRSNIRPACSQCNSSQGGGVRR